MIRRRSLCIAGLAAAALLSACAGAQVRFFTLDPVAASATAARYAGPQVRVDTVHIPPILDRVELVRETAAGRLAVSDNDHWAAPLGELMRQALTQDLAARLPNGAVIFPQSPLTPVTDGLSIDVLAISQSGGEVVMDVAWTLIPAHKPGTPPVALATQTARLSTPAIGIGAGGNAAEFSALMGTLADRIVAGLNVPAA